MRSKLLSLLMFFLLLSSVTPWAAAATAPILPSLRAPVQKINVTEVYYPRQVTAGEPFTVVVTAVAPAEGGICCGLLGLRGPANQGLFFQLYPNEDGGLTGTINLSKHTQPGTWTIEHVKVRSNSWQEITLDRSATWSHSFTVVGSGSKADTQGPTFRSLEVPGQATPGDAYAIRVKANDDLSGVEFAMATVQPAAQRYAGGVAEREPQWAQVVKLLPDETTGQLIGQMLMEESPNANHGLEIATLTIVDRAGNSTMLGQKELAASGFNRKTEATSEEPPAALTTSPDLTVIHAGTLGYTDWLSLDRQYLVEMVERLAQDPQATREYLVTELSQLQSLLGEIRSEVYTDPASGLRFVPFATSGKWLVLNQAMLHRNRLLSVDSRPDLALSGTEILGLQAEIRSNYTVTEGREWFDLPHGGNSTENRMALAYIRVLGRSPELAAALKSPAYQDPADTLISDLDRDLIYFVPIRARGALSRVRGWPMLRIPFSSPSSMANQVGLLFFQTGFHVGESLFSHPSDPDRSEWWAEYVALRGGTDWHTAKQAIESPASNLAADFAQTFAPEGAIFNMVRSYPELKGEQKAAFRELIQSGLNAPGTPAVSAAQGTKVGLADRHQMVLKPLPVNGSGMVQYPAFSNGTESSEATGSFTADRRSYTYRGDPQAMGDPIWHVLWTIDREWRYQYYITTYIRAPLLLDPVPTGTNQATVRLSGTTLPGKVITVASHSVTANKEGRFALEVPLKPGENELRLRVSGVEMGARIRVTYEPEGTAVPLEWEIPDKTARKWVEGEIRTVPYATLSIDGRIVRVGANGRMGYGRSLETGENVIRLVVTDRYGNTTTLEKRVIVTE